MHFNEKNIWSLLTKYTAFLFKIITITLAETSTTSLAFRGQDRLVRSKNKNVY